MSEREEFEAWYKPIYKPHSLLVKFRAGGYQCIQTQTAWMAWQAARSTPKQGDDEHMKRWVENRSQILDAIRAQGFALVQNVHGWALMKLGPIVAASAHQEPGWQPIETAPDSRTCFVVQGFNVQPTATSMAGYTTDPYCVWRGYDGEFVRWPHDFPPTHWYALPSAPKEPKP